MDLAADAREYAHTAIRYPPAGATPPQAYLGGAWVPMEWHTETGPPWDALLRELGVPQDDINDGTTRIARVLVAGPDADPDPDATTLPVGSHPFRVRLLDNPEVIPRTAGTIDVA